MGIRQICETIGNFFSNVRPPFPQLPRTLLVCSMIKRPGLSTITSVSNIVKDLNKLGIPTGPMPDGSMNLTVGVTFATTKEVYRGFKEDASIQVGVQPGSMMITAFGGNAGGPIVVKGMNTSEGMLFGKMN
jgi:secreted trypsin-like serine protease